MPARVSELLVFLVADSYLSRRMSFSLRCQSCGIRFRVSESSAGKRGRCPNPDCGKLLQVPTTEQIRRIRERDHESQAAVDRPTSAKSPSRTGSDRIGSDRQQPSAPKPALPKPAAERMGRTRLVKRALVGATVAAVLGAAVSAFRGERGSFGPHGSDSSSNLQLSSVAAASPMEPKPSEFPTKVQPFLKKYCFDCHQGDEAEAGLALDKARHESDLLARRKTWEGVLDRIEIQAMPPADYEPQPTAEERTAIAQWLDKTLFYVDCSVDRDPGRVTIRRLNRNEYNNTIRDLLGVTITPADSFPSDDVGYGFDNIGDVLTLPPLLLEKYLDAAEQVAAAAIVVGRPPGVKPVVKKGKQLKGTGSAKLGSYGMYGLPSRGSVIGSFEASRDGEYELRIEAAGQQAGDEPARMELTVDKQKVEVFDVLADQNAVGEYKHRLSLTAGQHQFEATFTNDYYNPKGPEGDRDRNLYIGQFTFDVPLDVRPHELPESPRQLVTCTPDESLSPTECAQKILRPFLERAWRRPVTSGEVDEIASIVDFGMEQGEPFEGGLRLAVQAALVSPHFLFRIERSEAPDDPMRRQSISEWELASRLSYFLWSTMPDAELFELARQGTLRRNHVFKEQVARMLADPKSDQLVKNFGGQWLNLRNLDDVTPDPKQFPEFNDALRQSMRRETELFFSHVMREDRSILDFLDGRYTFTNDRLASFYSGKPFEGTDDGEFQMVSLDGTPRAGVLTQASVLTITSNPTRTSPVKRGLWVLDNLLSSPPPDPPPNVPSLEETTAANPDATLREQLEQHRKDPACASCHKVMDPLGFGLENFDAIGRYREQERGKPLDTTGVLPTGEKFSGPLELIQILRGRERQFARALSEKMLTYAIGRGLEYYDSCAVDRIVDALAEDDYKFSTLVIEIVRSEPFQMRRGEERTQ